MLLLEEVRKRYGRGSWVLQDVDLEIPAGEVVAFTGENGSGKSTLLRLLVGLTRPTSGTVSGRPSVTGYVPDRFPPDERMSATAYLTHMGRIRGLSTNRASARADELLDRLALVGGKDSPLRTLSKGNAQKVALVQALLVQPQLLVLDEPWSGLDADAHGTLADLIADVAQAGGSVVFTDHRESITETPASLAYVINAGRVSPRGTAGHDGSSEIVLTAPSSLGGAHDVDWRAMDGVLRVTDQLDTMVIRVTRERSDALLLIALRHGWSVRGVTPIAAHTNDARVVTTTEAQ